MNTDTLRARLDAAVDATADALLANVPISDSALRAAARASCGRRLQTSTRGSRAAQLRRVEQLVAELRRGPIAGASRAANDQHYTVPAAFFEQLLGPRLKYSCCSWDPGVTDLAAAEEAMLALVVERAGIRDGMRILDLGCGWGSLSSWLCEQFDDVQVEAVSDSATQRDHIVSHARRDGYADRLDVHTVDIGSYVPKQPFDRVVSIEMFEHLRNWDEALRRVATWLTPQGRFFLHVFAHRSDPYLYDRGWMARNFFTGGVMPSLDLIDHFTDDLVVTERWEVNGTHSRAPPGPGWRT